MNERNSLGTCVLAFLYGVDGDVDLLIGNRSISSRMIIECGILSFMVYSSRLDIKAVVEL